MSRKFSTGQAHPIKSRFGHCFVENLSEALWIVHRSSELSVDSNLLLRLNYDFFGFETLMTIGSYYKHSPHGSRQLGREESMR